MCIGLIGFPVGYLLLSHAINPQYMSSWALVLLGVPAQLALFGTWWMLEDAYFKYDIHNFSIKGHDPWRGRTTFPRRGFTHLEYSPAHAVVFQVRADGSRKRLWIKAKWAEPTDWEEFVEWVLKFQARRSEQIDTAPDSK